MNDFSIINCCVNYSKPRTRVQSDTSARAPSLSGGAPQSGRKFDESNSRNRFASDPSMPAESAITLSSGSVFLMDVNDDLPRQARDEHNSTVENREGFQRCVLLSPHIIQHHCHELESSLACPGEFDSDGGDVWIACKPPQLFLLEYSHCCKQE